MNVRLYASGREDKGNFREVALLEDYYVSAGGLVPVIVQRNNGVQTRRDFTTFVTFWGAKRAIRKYLRREGSFMDLVEDPAQFPPYEDLITDVPLRNVFELH